MAAHSKEVRLAEANDVIAAISRHGRRFFYSAEHDRNSRFEMDSRGKLWLIDKYTGRRVYVSYTGEWRAFSDGGTLRRLIEALANYIRSGEKMPSSHFGPWPDWFCDGDLWGYGAEAMAQLRTDLRQHNAIAFPKPRESEASTNQQIGA